MRGMFWAWIHKGTIFVTDPEPMSTDRPGVYDVQEDSFLLSERLDYEGVGLTDVGHLDFLLGTIMGIPDRVLERGPVRIEWTATGRETEEESCGDSAGQ